MIQTYFCQFSLSEMLHKIEEFVKRLKSFKTFSLARFGSGHAFTRLIFFADDYLPNGVVLTSGQVCALSTDSVSSLLNLLPTNICLPIFLILDLRTYIMLFTVNLFICMQNQGICTVSHNPIYIYKP